MPYKKHRWSSSLTDGMSFTIDSGASSAITVTQPRPSLPDSVKSRLDTRQSQLKTQSDLAKLYSLAEQSQHFSIDDDGKDGLDAKGDNWVKDQALVAEMESINQTLHPKYRFPSMSQSVFSQISLQRTTASTRWKEWMTEEDKADHFRDALFCSVWEYERRAPEVKYRIQKMTARDHAMRSSLVATEMAYEEKEGESMPTRLRHELEEKISKDITANETEAASDIANILKDCLVYLKSASLWQDSMEEPCPLSVGIREATVSLRNARKIVRTLDAAHQQTRRLSKRELGSMLKAQCDEYSEILSRYPSTKKMKFEARDEAMRIWCAREEYGARLAELSAGYSRE